MIGDVKDGSFILITGDNGVGKTILALQLASQLNKETLIITTNEFADEVEEKLRKFNFKLNYRIFCTLPNVTSLDSSDIFTLDFDAFISLIDGKEKVIVLDSIDFLEFMLEDFNLFRRALLIIKSLIKRKKKILIAVSSVYSTKEKENFEEYLADIVIDMYFKKIDNRFERYLRIIKNRFGNVNDKEYRFIITEGKGIVTL